MSLMNRLLQSQYFGPESWQRGMTEQLYGIKLSDPLTLIVTGSVLILVALIACWFARETRRESRSAGYSSIRIEGSTDGGRSYPESDRTVSRLR